MQDQINVRAWDLYHEGLGLKKKAKYHEAIDASSAWRISARATRRPRKPPHSRSRHGGLIAELRDPVLAEASSEDARIFRRPLASTKRPPRSIRLILQVTREWIGSGEFSMTAPKAIYIDAVLSESYSDFETAKKKYQECKDVAPKDDIYYERAERKLATFFKVKEEQPQ